MTTAALTHAVNWRRATVTRGEPGSAESDEALVARAVLGDDGAFTVLVDRHRDRVFQFLRFTLLGDRAEAEDAAQETFLQVHRALRSFQGRSSFRTWLYGVARNVSRHCGSPAARRADAQADEEALLDVPDHSPDPLARLEQLQIQHAVRDAIDTLSPFHRAVVFLRDIDGRSYEEIAAALGVPVGTVRSRLHNARARLAERLRDAR